MIKIIGKFLVILLVACLVAGGIYWLVQSNPSILGLGNGLPGLEAKEGFSGRPGLLGGDDIGKNPFGEGTFGGPHQGFGDSEFEGQRDQSGTLDARTLGGIGRNLLIIALTTLGVLGIQKVFSFIKRRRLASAVQQ